MFTIEIKIQEIRKKKNISLRKLEKLTGLERHYLSNLEHSEASEIKLDEIILIAMGLGTTIEKLFDIKNIEFI